MLERLVETRPNMSFQAKIRWFFFFFFFFFFMTTPMAYGSSQARGLIGAAAAGLHHSSAGSELHLQPTPQLTINAGSLTH